MPLVRCPECEGTQVVRSELLGLHVTCKKCGEEFRAKESRRAEPQEDEGPAGGGVPIVPILAGVGLVALLGLFVGCGVGLFALLRPAPQPVPPAPVAQATRPTRPEVAVRPTPPAQQKAPAAVQPSAEPTSPSRAAPPAYEERPKPAAIDPGLEAERGRIEAEESERKGPLAGAANEPRDPAPARRTGDADNPFFNPPGAAKKDGAAQAAPDDVPKSAPRPKGESPAVPGYYARKIHGFTVLISRLAYDMSDEGDGLPLGYIETELARVEGIFPRRTLATLLKVPIWVEWDHAVPGRANAIAIYYGGSGEGLQFEGVDPRKSQSVVIMSLKRAYAQRQKGWRGLVVLHELAHAVHDQIVGTDNAFIRNAYEQAMTRNLYRDVRFADQTIRKGYATTNEMEYFAEISRAYLDVLDYYPSNRKELREYDAAGYEMMERVWGRPESIAAEKEMDAKRKKK